jgi:hypothetical protein
MRYKLVDNKVRKTSILLFTLDDVSASAMARDRRRVGADKPHIS